MVDDISEARDISGRSEGPTANLTESKTDENLWASVLSEVQTSRNSQLPASKNLLVLGDKESGNTSEGVLANFFNSLLSKKTGQPGSPGTQVKSAAGNDDYKAAVRSDAAAELDRLTRGAQKKPTGGSGSNSIDNSLNNSEC